MFVVAVVSLILAVVFWLQGRSAAEAVVGLKAEADSARKEADEARAQARRGAPPCPGDRTPVADPHR